MAEQTKKFPLRTVDDINRVHEFVLEKLMDGTMETKTADAMNATLKGVTYLNAKLKLDAAKLLIQAKIKNVTLPDNVMPTLAELAAQDRKKRLSDK